MRLKKSGERKGWWEGGREREREREREESSKITENLRGDRIKG